MCGIFFILNPFLYIPGYSATLLPHLSKCEELFSTRTCKLNPEVRAFACMMFNNDRYLVIFDNAIGNRETQARSRPDLFRGEECDKGTLLQFCRATRASIAH